MNRRQLSWAIVGSLVLVICLGGQCKPNRARPAALRNGETTAAWYAEFFAALGERENDRWGGAIVYTRQTQAGLTIDDSKAAAQVFKPVPEDNRMVLAILYNPDELTDPPPMQLQLLAKKTRGDVVLGEPGDPVVLCDLTLSQARQVIKDRTVPRSLRRAMVKAARDSGWSPNLPAPNRYGAFVRIQPDGHFGGQQQPDQDGEGGEEEEIPLSEVPDHVKNAAVAAVPGIVLAEADVERAGDTLVYELEGEVDGKKYEIKVNAAGEVLDIETDDAEGTGDDEDD